MPEDTPLDQTQPRKHQNQRAGGTQPETATMGKGRPSLAEGTATNVPGAKDAPLSKSQIKKQERSAMRRDEKAKRKAAKAAKNEPDIAALAILAVDEKPKKSKKRKVDDVDQDPPATHEDAVTIGDATAGATAGAPQSKKRKGNTETVESGKAGDGTVQDASSTKPRFIVFVGNLPFETRDETLRAHFQKLEPFTLRHRCDPQTNKSKGFAFMEFENYDRMKTCLKLYHHSIFDPRAKEYGGSGKGSGKRARKINVELTSGGGGNTMLRKEKIKVKNDRLAEQRKRRAELERKQKKRAVGKKDGAKATEGTPESDGGVRLDAAAEDNNQGIHPSRLARINKQS